MPLSCIRNRRPCGPAVDRSRCCLQIQIQKKQIEISMVYGVWYSAQKDRDVKSGQVRSEFRLKETKNRKEIRDTKKWETKYEIRKTKRNTRYEKKGIYASKENKARERER